MLYDSTFAICAATGGADVGIATGCGETLNAANISIDQCGADVGIATGDVAAGGTDVGIATGDVAVGGTDVGIVAQLAAAVVACLGNMVRFFATCLDFFIGFFFDP